MTLYILTGNATLVHVMGVTATLVPGWAVTQGPLTILTSVMKTGPNVHDRNAKELRMMITSPNIINRDTKATGMMPNTTSLAPTNGRHTKVIRPMPGSAGIDPEIENRDTQASRPVPHTTVTRPTNYRNTQATHVMPETTYRRPTDNRYAKITRPMPKTTRTTPTIDSRNTQAIRMMPHATSIRPTDNRHAKDINMMPHPQGISPTNRRSAVLIRVVPDSASVVPANRRFAAKNHVRPLSVSKIVRPTTVLRTTVNINAENIRRMILTIGLGSTMYRVVTFKMRMVLIPASELPTQRHSPIDTGVMPSDFMFIVPLIHSRNTDFKVRVTGITILTPGRSDLQAAIKAPFHGQSATSTATDGVDG